MKELTEIARELEAGVKPKRTIQNHLSFINLYHIYCCLTSANYAIKKLKSVSYKMKS